jgi:hypothetical protein
VFKEFFWHNRFCRLGEDLPSRLSKKVPLLSNFCDHIESLSHDPHSIVWQAGKKHCDCFDTHSEWNPSPGLQTGVPGFLKLQLVDVTGALDVMIPDLQCFANLSSTYQVAVFQAILWFPSLSP